MSQENLVTLVESRDNWVMLQHRILLTINNYFNIYCVTSWGWELMAVRLLFCGLLLASWSELFWFYESSTCVAVHFFLPVVNRKSSRELLKLSILYFLCNCGSERPLAALLPCKAIQFSWYLLFKLFYLGTVRKLVNCSE